MTKKKVCKKCKIFVEKDQCPVCGAQGSQLSTSWQGRINIIDKDKSQIAQNMEIEKNGEYAIKVR
jgi:DNA-directed RNA polymerase subunit E"